MYIIYGSPEIRPVSVAKKSNVWGRLRKGTFLTCLKPKTGRIMRNNKAAPTVVQPKGAKTSFLTKICKWPKRKAKGKAPAPKPKAKPKGVLDKLNCCKKKPKPVTNTNPTNPRKNFCRRFWRAFCCLDRACCAKCKKSNKPDRRKEKRQSVVGFPKLEQTLVEHSSVMKGAIPVLPACLAWFCLFLNVFLPGIGTVVSGLLCLCFGKPRFSVNDTAHSRLGSFCVNLIVGVSQLFTVIFCLVGWGWSIWWGVIMVKLARKNKRIKLAEKNAENAPAPVAANQNHDVEAR